MAKTKIRHEKNDKIEMSDGGQEITLERKP
jgi:hypothetical protein